LIGRIAGKGSNTLCPKDLASSYPALEAPSDGYAQLPAAIITLSNIC